MDDIKKPYMVEQVIKFSDGTETVISYNELGDKIESPVKEIEAVVEEEIIAEELAEEVTEEVAPESIEDSVEN